MEDRTSTNTEDPYRFGFNKSANPSNRYVANLISVYSFREGFILACKKEVVKVKSDPFVKVNCTIDRVRYESKGIYFRLADPDDRLDLLLEGISDESGEVNFGEVLPDNYVIFAGA